jgi:hypothetical protein
MKMYSSKNDEDYETPKRVWNILDLRT